MTSTELQDEINKRHTLNLLIQGAAMHYQLVAHDLVTEEFNAFHPDAEDVHRRLSHMTMMSAWSEMQTTLSLPRRFWKKVNRPSHPFHAHRFLRKHGPRLSRDAKRRVRRQAFANGVSRWPGVRLAQLCWWTARGVIIDEFHAGGDDAELRRIARLATQRIWGIEEDRLITEIAMNCRAEIRPHARTRSEKRSVLGVAGWSKVVRLEDGRLGVQARAIGWSLLVHELVKGVAELICLDAMGQLDDETYQAVIERTDRLEFELYLMQAGIEAWRYFLEAMEPQHTPAEYLLHVAGLPGEELDELMMQLVEDPPKARRILGDLMDVYVEPEPWIP
ncbi:MAG: hypothetical protein AAGB29_13610 [Planctomycetota bacterium]